MKTDWAPKQRREREYWRSLRLWFKHFMEYLTSSNIADPSQIIPELDAYCQAQGEFAYRAASNMITALFSDGKRSWREAARESMMGPQFYRALQDELQGRVGIRLQELITENAQLISTFSQISAGGVTLAEQVNNFIEEESLKGRRAKDIADDLREQFPDVAESRIALIARTEVSKSATALTRARSEELGLNFYTWQTSQDARVRESHRFMGRDGGVLVNWNDPPSPEELIGIKSALGHYHSGDCPNCRCYPAPLLRLDEIAWPHRVYIGGRVQTMTRGGLETGEKIWTTILIKSVFKTSQALALGLKSRG